MSSLKAHFCLEDGGRFLNHGSFGACPRPVLEYQAKLREELESNPVRFMLERRSELLFVVRHEAARFVNARPDDLVFVTNATSGVNAVLRSLRLRPGDEILTTDHLYGACFQAARFVSERCGARVIAAEVPFPLEDPRQVTEAIVARVTGRTRLALIDHVTSLTGLVLPIAEIVHELSARGVETLVDGAHAPGMVEVDLTALGAAYYAANFHKWVCAPKGAAMLWVRADKRASVFPCVISHGYADESDERYHRLFDWTGTEDPTPVLCVGEALRFMSRLFPGGWPQLMAYNRDLALEARGLLCVALGCAAPAPEGMIGSLVSVLLPGKPAPEPMPRDPIYRALREHGFETLVMPWKGERVLRVTAQAYNSRDDYSQLACLLPSVLASAS